MKVTKFFEFESAHRLSNYEGKCKRIHGHNYKVVVTCETEALDDKGMVVDFGDIKDAFKEINDMFDHRLILKENDELNDQICKVLPLMDVVWMKENPTAENMAKLFLEILRKELPSVTTVEVFETPDSSAIASI